MGYLIPKFVHNFLYKITYGNRHPHRHEVVRIAEKCHFYLIIILFLISASFRQLIPSKTVYLQVPRNNLLSVICFKYSYLIRIIFKKLYWTFKCDHNKYNHSGSEWTWEVMAWRSTPHLHFQYWNLNIRCSLVSYPGHHFLYWWGGSYHYAGNTVNIFLAVFMSIKHARTKFIFIV